jgi:hypothetical protein
MLGSDLLTLDVWKARLEHQGQRFIKPEWETVTGFTLWPDASTVLITVTVDVDQPQYPHGRERFFLCVTEPEKVFRGVSCPKLHQERWRELVSRQPPGYWQDFLAGPGSWLLARLARFQRVVAWADRGLPWDGLDSLEYRQWGMVIPTAAAPFFAATAGPEATRPRLVPVSDGRFPDVVAACLLFSSVGLRDCYLADEAGTEVYQVQHHDKVVVSIPNVESRDQLLRRLEDAPWLFTDDSENRFPSDENQHLGGPRHTDS